MKKHRRQTILFICTHNSARSQLAEGFINALWADKFQAKSAGTTPTHLHPAAVEVMKETGIDISRQSSKNIQMFLKERFDYVITVCDGAQESCPFFSGKKVIHKSFIDPSRIRGSDQEILTAFRKIRDEIRLWLEETFGKGRPGDRS